MQRIPNGVTDQYIYFFAVDSSDLITPETGLSSFTVRRSRNGGASAAMTTPTINETDSSNMPGWYELLMDEDTTLDSGDHSQVMALHITQASMAPAKVLVEIYRPDVTAGETLTVSSGAVSTVASVTAIATGGITAGSIAADAIGASELAADAATEIGTAVWATATRTLTALDEDSTTLDLDATIRSAIGLTSANLDTQLDALPTAAENTTAVWAAGTRVLTAGTNIALAKGTGVTGFTDLSQADVRSAVGLASANLDTQIADLPTANENADALLDRSAGVETGLTFRQWLRLAASTLFGKASGLETTTAVFRDFGDTKDRVTATVDVYGNRTAVTKDAT